jgi:transposase
METSYFGIDISKDSLETALCTGMEKNLSDVLSFQNSDESIGDFIKDLKENYTDAWVVFEHTGAYGARLTALLLHHDVRFSIVSPLEIKRSSGLVRGKDDQVDAKRIALYAATHAHKLKPYQPLSDNLLKIKSLMTARDLFVKQSTQLKNAIKAQKQMAPLSNVQLIFDSFQAALDEAEKHEESINKEIDNLIKQDEQLCSTYRKATSVVGIGPVNAAAIMVATNNFNSFTDPRKFNCHSGLAPFPYMSGSSVRKQTTTSKLREHNLKRLLMGAACSAVMHDPQLKQYYQRKLDEGKVKKSVLNAVACKLVYRVFAVVNRDEPYVKFNQPFA